MKKKHWLTVLMSLLFIACLIFSTVIMIHSISSLIRETETESSLLLANEISKDILSTFEESKTVSRAIESQIKLMRPYFTDDAAFAQEVGKYFTDLIGEFGLSTAFMVLDENKEYITEHGYSKTIDLLNEDDGWYPAFRDSGKDLELNMDNDQANANRITIYINLRITGEDGSFLGVCGVGKVLTELNEKLASIRQNTHQIVHLVSPNGFIQISGEMNLKSRIVSEELLTAIESHALEENFSYETSGEVGYRLIRYLPELGWYLIIESTTNPIEEHTGLLFEIILSYIITLVLLILFYLWLLHITRKNAELKKSSEVEPMTGLLNRSAYEEKVKDLRSAERAELDGLTIFVVDLNGLKQANDTLGHDVGDLLIVATADIIRQTLHEPSFIYRIGGDEFIGITPGFYGTPSKTIQQLKTNTERWKGPDGLRLSLAIGCSQGMLDEGCRDIDELIRLADKRMYADKEQYYQMNNLERR